MASLGNKLLTIRELADAYQVSKNTVHYWRRRGLPTANKWRRGLQAFFDKQQVDDWLAAQGIVPGAHGREGGRARAAAAGRQPAMSGSEKPGLAMVEGASGQTLPLPHGLGLESAVERLRVLEQFLGNRMLQILQTAKPLEAQGAIRNYAEVCEELRKAEGGLIEVQQARGELVSRDDMLDSLTHLAAVIRSAVERLPDEVPTRIVGAAAGAGIQVSDLGAFQRLLRSELLGIVEAWLSSLSDDVRRIAERDAVNGDSNGVEAVGPDSGGPDSDGTVDAESVGGEIPSAERGDNGPAGTLAK